MHQGINFEDLWIDTFSINMMIPEQMFPKMPKLHISVIVSLRTQYCQNCYKAYLKCEHFLEYLQVFMFMTKIVYTPPITWKYFVNFAMLIRNIMISLWTCSNTSTNGVNLKPFFMLSLSYNVSWYVLYHISGIVICTEIAKYSIISALN